jgi:hypothetical protein
MYDHWTAMSRKKTFILHEDFIIGDAVASNAAERGCAGGTVRAVCLQSSARMPILR